MPEFNAPLRDMRFVLHEVFEAPALWARLPALADHVDADTADAILEEAAKVTGQLIAPLNRSGDEQGAQWHAGKVTTPEGFKAAYTPISKVAGSVCRAIPSSAAWACRKCSLCNLKKCSTVPTQALPCIQR